MASYPQSQEILQKNAQYIPGGVVSTNRAVDPRIVFDRADGAWLWDAEGNRYLDFHAAFAPYMLGHNDRRVNDAVTRVLADGASLFGSGTTRLEGRLAELLCTNIPFVEQIQVLNTGSEATYQALRLARAATGHDHVIKMQGGYHGWHNDVACNLMTPLGALGPRVSEGEYPVLPISAGIPAAHRKLVHIVNFNDLASVEWVCQHYPVAALIVEPILQNIGVVHPRPGYLAGLRALADRYGFVLIFDEVKTGFRHAIGGYAEVSGVSPDLVVYGKAIANGYPISVLGGKRELMSLFVAPEADRRVLLAGTYNAHPVPVAAAIATIEALTADGGAVYQQLESLGAKMEAGLTQIAREQGIPALVARQGSAFCLYFADRAPADWHDVASLHNAALDTALRLRLIERGVYVFPLAAKQWSISAAHTEADLDFALEQTAAALAECTVAA